MTPLLDVRDLHVWFDTERGGQVHAVRGASFAVSSGEGLGLVGESGCGKTTAILALMGLLPPSATVAGEIRLGGENLLTVGEASFRPHRWTDVAMVFQGAMNAFSPVATVGAQIAEPMKLHGVATGKAAERRVGELLELVGIPRDRAKRYPHEFSGGMRQRAAIAMALACEPQLLLADEPTTALDVIVQAQILELLDQLRRELGLAVVLVTHDVPMVAQICQRVAVMYAGQVVEDGDVGALYGGAVHPYTQKLLTAARELVVREPGLSPVLGAQAAHRGVVVSPGRTPLPGPPPPCAASTWTPNPDKEPGSRTTRAGVARMTDGIGADVSGQEPLLRVDGLVTQFDVPRGLVGMFARAPRRVARAVDGVSFAVGRGEMLAVVGESGSGKTTTAQTLLRMVEPVAGTIRFGGQDIAGLGQRALKPVRRRMQVVYQDPYESLDPRFRIGRSVAEPLVVHGIGGNRGERRERAVTALERAGLTPGESFLDRYPHELSGGQRQRVAIAAALVLEPELLIADEPVSMLDVSVRAGVLSLFDRLRASDLAIVMITHDLSTAVRHADRIAVMYLGRIVEEGPAADVVRKPVHPYTRALIEAVPRSDRRDRPPQAIAGEPPDPTAVPSGCRFRTRCASAVDACSTDDPPLLTVNGPTGHRAACPVEVPMIIDDRAPHDVHDRQ